MSLFLLSYSIDMIVSLGKGKIRKWVFIITSWTYCRIEQTLKQVPKWQINIQNIYSALEKILALRQWLVRTIVRVKWHSQCIFFSLAKMRRLWISDREIYYFLCTAFELLFLKHLRFFSCEYLFSLKAFSAS
jgi:hypothetical protein